MSSYKLVRPCINCPFRTDVPPYLRRDRAIEISHSLATGGTFPCHKTTHLDDEDDEYGGDYIEMGGEQFCAGALIMMEKMEQPNQMLRVAERVGVYDRHKLDMDAPVVNNYDEFANHHSDTQEEPDAECCSVCGPDCVAPAGYMMGGAVVPASFDPDDVGWCSSCGEPVCCECQDDGRCNWCVEDEDE